MAPLRTTALGSLIAGALALAPLSTAVAQTTDPLNDYLASYTGPHNGDLDVTSVQVLFDGSNFTFIHTSAAAIGTTPGGFFVWGVNRGQGTARFADIAPGVLFDFVISVTPGGAATTRDLIANVSGTVTPSQIFIAGNRMTVVIPLSAMPSLGFTPSNYTFNLWPRAPGQVGNAAISDFAPNNSNIGVTVSPEPATFLLLGPGLFTLALVQRRRRRSVSSAA